MTVREIFAGLAVIAVLPVMLVLDLFDALTGRWRRP